VSQPSQENEVTKTMLEAPRNKHNSPKKEAYGLKGGKKETPVRWEREGGRGGGILGSKEADSAPC